MNKLRLFTAITPILLALTACNQNAKHDSIAKADSVNATKDTTKQLSIAVEKGDAQFTVAAASGGMTEVTLGKMAHEKGVNRRVKSFGMMMVTDHSKLNNMIKAIAVTKNISLPKAPGVDEQKLIASLTKKSGGDFDKAYVAAMISDHEDDIKMFQKAAKNCADPDVKSFAAKTIPVLQAHLDAINAIKDSMK